MDARTPALHDTVHTMGPFIGCNVESRLVWGSLIVRSFAEIIQHPLGSFLGPIIVRRCAPAQKNNFEKKLVEQISLICFESHGRQEVFSSGS